MASGHHGALLGLIYNHSIKSKRKAGEKQTAASKAMRTIAHNRQNQGEYWGTLNELQLMELALPDIFGFVRKEIIDKLQIYFTLEKIPVNVDSHIN